MRKLLILTTLLLLACPLAALAQNDSLTISRLERENFILKLQLRELREKLNEKNSLSISSVETVRERLPEGFYSIADRWDELEGTDDGFIFTEEEESGLVAVSSVDTLLYVPQDDVLQKYIDIYTVLRKDNMKRILLRYDRYLPMLRKAFARHDVPQELTMLCIVESAANSNAVSKVGATGLWQFMPGTAKDYGLEVTTLIDDRYDPVKSSEAAASYLSDLHRTFGSWSLALMAYNYGIGNVQKAVRACNGDLSYANINKYLPRETREYIPALVAIMYVNNNRMLIYD